MRIIEREIVAAQIYSQDGKLFLGLDNPAYGAVYPGCWKIPGGGVEEGESKSQALVREIKEEIGLDVSSLSLELLDDKMIGESEKTLKDTGERVLVKMQFFTYKIVLNKLASDVEIRLDSREFEEYRWFDISELASIKLSPPSIELFTKLGLLNYSR